MPSESAQSTLSPLTLPAADWRTVLAWPLWLRLLLPVLAALIVGAAFQGSRGLMETSETRYAECAREMVATGDWMEPGLEYQPHWTKPPVAYWCIAAGIKLFGVNAWGARLPGVLALMLATLAVTLAGRRIWGEAAGLAAGLAFAVGFLPFFGAYTATTDIFLAAAEALAAAAFLFAATEAAPLRRHHFAVAMWAAWGVGFMIKGPPALLPLLAFIPWNLLQPRERRVPLGNGIGILVFALIGFAWFLVMIERHPDLINYWFSTEVVARVSSDMGHNRAWYMAFREYGPALLFSLGVPGLWALKLSLREGRWTRVARWRELWAARDLRLLAVAWVVLPMIVFTLSSSKLPLYVLPLAMPLALLAGKVLAEWASWRSLCRIVVGTLLVIVAVKGVAPAVPNWQNKDMAALGQAIRGELAGLPAGAPVVLWDEEVNHGVSFYLQSTRESLCERIAAGEKGKFEQWSVAEFRQRCAAGRYPQGALLVVSAEKRPDFDAALPQLPMVAERKGRFWHLLRLGPAVAETGAAQRAGATGG